MKVFLLIADCYSSENYKHAKYNCLDYCLGCYPFRWDWDDLCLARPACSP